MWGLWWTKRHWGRFSPSTSFSPANHHSTNFSIIIITRGWQNRLIGGRSSEWTQSDSTPHYTNSIYAFVLLISSSFLLFLSTPTCYRKVCRGHRLIPSSMISCTNSWSQGISVIQYRTFHISAWKYYQYSQNRHDTLKYNTARSLVTYMTFMQRVNALTILW
jgi:hypothetical protein